MIGNLKFWLAANLLAWTLLAFLIVTGWTPRAHRERWYQERWAAANGGVVEHRLPDGTRVDILTATEAIEVDFAEKWAEAIGQALWYGAQTGRRPGVVLIVRGAQAGKYAERIRAVAEAWTLPLAVYEVLQSGETPEGVTTNPEGGIR